MAGDTSQEGSTLENQLRNMILSNVTISSEQANQGPAAQGFHHHHSRGRGRGRGRGGFFRGRGRGSHAPVIGSPVDGIAPATDARGENVWPGRRRGNGFPPLKPATSDFPSVADEHQPGEMPSKHHHHRRPRGPRQSAQIEPESTISVGGPLPPHQPRILQRPQQEVSANHPDGQPRTPNVRHSFRPYGFHSHAQQPLENPVAQVNYLDHAASQEVPKAEITLEELEEKESFRQDLEAICQKAFAENYSGDIATINLVGFGSLASGFATPGSDMDLAIVPGWKDPSKAQTIGIDREIPRMLERAVLDAKLGGRLLTRTRVPILKVCQKPTEELYKALAEERQKWEELPDDEKYATAVAPPEPKTPAETGNDKGPRSLHNFQDFPTLQEALAVGESSVNTRGKESDAMSAKKAENHTLPSESNANSNSQSSSNVTNKEQHSRNEKQWLREKALGPLDFPKTGVGIQCDINFENPLGIHNTHLLRCYSLCDPRVRPMVLFVKAWAKRRKINSSYSGTLSSYGWVLMVLHYLVNIANPPVCPNLQSAWRPPANTTDMAGLEQMFKDTIIGGYVVRFWRNEEEILHAARSGQLSHNDQSVGALLRGFFQYYASIPPPYMYGPKPPSFYWTSEVLSLRTPGGIRMKLEKGWTGAKTTLLNGKEVRHRYLFCIEDPFELDHNVARTVTHNGIVAIRDEFRRVSRILSAIGKGQPPEGDLFDDVIEQMPPPTPKKIDGEAKENNTTGQDVPVDSQPAVNVGKAEASDIKAEDTTVALA